MPFVCLEDIFVKGNSLFVDAIKVAIKSEADGSACLYEEMNALTLYLCLYLAALFVVSSLTKEREHSVIVLFQTLRFGMKNGLRRAVGQKRAKCCDAVQNASFCKVLQAVLGDEAKCLGVYHHVNKKCRNEENKKKMRGLSYFLLFLLSYFLLSQSWAAVMSDSRTVVACLTRCSSMVSTKAGGS